MKAPELKCGGLGGSWAAAGEPRQILDETSEKCSSAGSAVRRRGPRGEPVFSWEWPGGGASGAVRAVHSPWLLPPDPPGDAGD